MIYDKFIDRNLRFSITEFVIFEYLDKWISTRKSKLKVLVIRFDNLNFSSVLCYEYRVLRTGQLEQKKKQLCRPLNIVPNGAADQDGRLKTGDQILIIGNTNLIGCAQSDAVAKISKQNKSDDGIQMIIAKKAAHYHKIVELIKPKTIINSTSNNHINHDNRYIQSTELSLIPSENKHRIHDLLHLNQSQPDVS
ncbi:unnamed protein product [Schistosoma curassoni]|uniref:PDZ domain-containing protein n=1 Tax=Schistosoma curassoni TaxID=6186 RepID=A0A183L5H4_9TREM|nr:unnamed protein product [Schistosoma curassoni]